MAAASFKKLLILSFLCSVLLLNSDLFAQEAGINTDRPDQSDGVYTVQKKVFQLEYGITAARKTFMK